MTVKKLMPNLPKNRAINKTIKFYHNLTIMRIVNNYLNTLLTSSVIALAFAMNTQQISGNKLELFNLILVFLLAYT